MFGKLYKLYINNYHFLYVVLLSIFVASMPHSRALLSSSQIGLVLLWFLDVNFNQKFTKLKKNKALLIFLSIYLLHIVGLLYTSNFSYAFHDLKVKLPLLILPLIIATSRQLGAKEIKLILSIFTLSVFIKTLYGFAVLFGLTETEIQNIQEISGKFSHIRYALMLNIIIFANIYFMFIFPIDKKRYSKILRLISIIWFSVFLFILHSLTGWVIFFVLTVFTGFYVSRNSKGVLKKYGLIFSFGFSVILILYLAFLFHKFYKTDIVDVTNVDVLTKSGNFYWHNFESKSRENGHFVDLYISEQELEDTWNTVSNYEFQGIDEREQKIKYTLIRYLTSKNLRKDREGVLELSAKDIGNIEDGLANYIYENKYALYPKVYEVLWQIDKYIKGGNPEKHSVTQRFEFVKIGKKIILDNFWIGVGTGDVPDKFSAEYIKNSSKLSDDYRLRSHNQYITFFITFGLIGFLWILFAYIYPIIKEKKYNDYLFLVTFIIMSLSMFNEDTLETQMGVTTFAFFISLFLFSNTLKKKNMSDQTFENK